MKKILISFASSDPKYGERFLRSQQFLVNSAKKQFDGYISFLPENIDLDFFNKHKHIFDQKKGFGFFLWKPYVIHRALNHLNDGDILFYVDSGNSIINDLTPLFNYLLKDKNGIILFDNRDGSPPGTIWKNSQWTKYDCFKKMNCLEDKYVKGDQVNASYVLLQKNNFTCKFIEEFLQYSCDEQILTDLPNQYGDNFPDFTWHRWDQSVLSLLAIKYNITIARDPSEWGTPYIIDKTLYDFPQMFHHHRGFF
jgi:hypothetical protein